MASISPEYRTIQKNTAKINEVISSKNELNSFADKLVEKDFISKLTADGIVQTQGIRDYNKVSQLMQSVGSQISTASNPTPPFKTFITILSSITSLSQLADELSQFYSECFGQCFVRLSVLCPITPCSRARWGFDYI